MSKLTQPERNSAEHGPAVRIDTVGLRQLFDLVLKQYDEVFGPRVRDDAMTLELLNQFEDLPIGYEDSQQAGAYALQQTDTATMFHYAVGPHSVKKVLHPSSRRLWRAAKTEDGWKISDDSNYQRTVALFGIRSCDVESIRILDKVFVSGDYIEPHYRSIREGLLLITASCPAPSAVCFCTSMGHGPHPNSYDINLTEIQSAEEHFFIADAGSSSGRAILDQLEAARPASAGDLQAAEQCIRNARDRIEKKIDTKNLASEIAACAESPKWSEIGERCLACGNCTMVCPTCFCTTTYDVTELDGAASEHWQRWDSCFNADFSFIHGGTIRDSVGSRYRQWLSHKLSTWHDQFASSGCVGCGRCIAWCPVKIDIVEEARRLRD